MNLSEQGKDLLIAREGKRTKAYLDTKGIPTIGVGHTGPNVYIGLAWTDQQIEDAFAGDVKWAEDAVNLYVTVPLEQHQFDALVSFVFNVGVPAFSKSTMLRKLNNGDYEGAENEFNRWIIPKEITPRRMAEKHQFVGSLFVARV